MKRLLAAAASLAALTQLAPNAASATSIASAPKHRQELACAAIDRLVANLNSGDLDANVPFPGPTVYTDALGEVGLDEEETFLAAMRNSEGKADRKPIRLDGVYKVRGDAYQPTYLIALEREVWRLQSYEDDGMLGSYAVDNPHWQTERSFWLVTFQSNHIDHVRETPELDRLAAKTAEVEGCRKDW
jgi:hypothetical protein